MLHEELHRTLKRLLVNGPLTGFPSRQTDLEMLVRLAGSLFEPGREYREPDVNALLADWLATFCAPDGIDHVSIRRNLVDRRMLVRDTAGRMYRAVAVEAMADARAMPAQVLEETGQARALRKERRAQEA